MNTKDKKSEHEIQAEDFLKKTNCKMEVKRTGFGKYFPNEKDERDIYTIVLSREGKKPFSFSFGQSIANSGTIDKNYETSRSFWQSGRHVPIKDSDFKRRRKEPTAYDVLACLTKYDPGSFEDFCSEFGYDNDSRKSEKIYFAVQKEWEEVNRMFGDVLEELIEIN